MSQQKSAPDRCEAIVQLYGASVPSVALSKGRTTLIAFQIPTHFPHPVIVKWPKRTVHISCVAWGIYYHHKYLSNYISGDLGAISVNIKQDCSHHREANGQNLKLLEDAFG